MNNELNDDTNKGSSILIVDDNPKNLQVLASILRTSNYKVAMVKDGAKAIKFISSRKPDLILLDIMMPELDGFEVCQKLKQSKTSKDIPIIFISALSETEDKVKGFEAGGVDYITKPFQQQEVLARVKTHLDLRNAYKKLKQAYKDIEIAAKTDSMTKLSNRLDIIEKIKYEQRKYQRSGNPFSLILSDIDNFKLFNDKYGHDCGDFILIAVADIIKSGIRKQDTAARWGGEEFLILLPETDKPGGESTAIKIRERLISKTFEYNEHPHKISMTFGISTFNGQGIDNCIKMADEALYKGKTSGKNCIVLSD
ncbi:Two component system response regulator, GGDEF domain-containing [Desulfonema limicola]|uniref:Two component system response regulator, GGDEF domain-containing n=1 Tax=Desulfonema limicola TaxID=45656 RepID=A0A975GFG3_9BACT|nr:diguanylate cyclase [Desulfonema limicola]QTA79271.1 Two component system response regulator, GGDEF domain-containing [Desulfonema limicola]